MGNNKSNCKESCAHLAFDSHDSELPIFKSLEEDRNTSRWKRGGIICTYKLKCIIAGTQVQDNIRRTERYTASTLSSPIARTVAVESRTQQAVRNVQSSRFEPIGHLNSNNFRMGNEQAAKLWNSHALASVLYVHPPNRPIPVSYSRLHQPRNLLLDFLIRQP